MPQELTELNAADLSHAKNLLTSQGPSGMYDFLASKGYKYPTLANGVAKGNSIAGVVAIDFMKSTASDAGRSLSDHDVDHIRGEMATGYMKTLTDKLEKSTSGTITSDITHSEAWKFHRDVFSKFGLPPETWTLHAVFSVLPEDDRDPYWSNVLNAAGNPLDELKLSYDTYQMMALPAALSEPKGPLFQELQQSLDAYRKAVLPDAPPVTPYQYQKDRGASEWIDRIQSPARLWTLSKGIMQVTAGSAANLINIEINPAPQPKRRILGEDQARRDVSNGYLVNRPTHSISFRDNTLDNTDFFSTQMGSFASGGIRPGEVQQDPNVRPNDYLSRFYCQRPAHDPLDLSLFNAVTLNGLSAMTTFNTYVDPLLLDLSGKGVKMTAISDGVLFDTDHSGTLKRTGWADRETGMLVIDDGSGQIKDISQMFSEYYRGQVGVNGKPGQTPFKDGFAALASEDADGNGVIDSADPIWRTLRVWVDKSHDANVDSGELKTLDQLGISQIQVGAVAVDKETQDGNKIVARGSFTLNGKTQEVLAVNFLSESVNSTVVTQGDGTKVTSTTGSSTTTAYTSHSRTDEILDAEQLNVTNLYAGSGNDILQALAGGKSWLVGGAGSNTYKGTASDEVFVISATDRSQNIHGNGGRDTAIIVGDKGMALNMAQAGLTMAQGGNGNDVIISGGQSSVFIKGGSGNATLIGGAGNDVLVGGTGRNTIIGGSGKAVIYAGSCGDTIYASAGGSIIHAGGGNDRIYGGDGNDVIEVGHGNAVIDGGKGINLVTLHGNYGDYLITGTETGYTVQDKISGRDGTVTLKNIQKLNFSDISAVDLTSSRAMPVSDVLLTDHTGKTFDRAQAHLILAADLLANDLRFNSLEPLHIATVGDATGGTVNLTQQGDVLFTPNKHFTGLMSFKYGIANAANELSSAVIDLGSGQSALMRATVTLLTPEIPLDPLVAQQWYLSDINVFPVWKDYSGKGVRIGQFEPGGQFAIAPEIFNIQHPDLVANVDQAWLQTQNEEKILPTGVSNHATMVAGVMVSEKNDIGGVGVAYDATLGGHYLANSGADLTGLGNMVNYDVVNHSWGFKDAFMISNLQEGRIDTASTLISTAQYAADHGRGGRGTIIVASGGNQRAQGGSTQGSLTNNNRFTIQVGAINAQADLSTLQIGSLPFSNPGASLLVSAPGSNVTSTSHMLKTERGSTFGNNYTAMQGTSFAAPIVSGVIALMLQANPNLGYRDVQQILALSARKIDDPPATKWSDNGALGWNGGGMHTSNDYGFGKIDARAAVRLAESWMAQSTGANKVSLSVASDSLGKTVSAGETVTSTLTMDAGLNIEHAEIDFDAQLGRLGDLCVKLISPDGTESILLNREGKIPNGVSGANENDVGNTLSGAFKYTFMSTNSWGEKSAGDWKLEVTDASNGLPVTLNRWSLRLYGSKTTADDTYFYTDEYINAVSGKKSRAVLDDNLNGTPGGRNTINAAAISGDTSINLATGVATLGGVALTIRHPNAIQNLVSGDGNDTLAASFADSLLNGGRGQNTLIGGTGKDIFVVNRRTEGVDTIVNFDAARGETLYLVGFVNKQFNDLVLTQQGDDVKLDLGEGQHILLKHQQVSGLAANHFKFQDTFVAPIAYTRTLISSESPADSVGTLVLNGGGGGVSYTTSADGQLIASLVGTVYSHDSARSNVFIVSKQTGVSHYRNVLRGFKQGIDKIDLSQTGITKFSQLTINKKNWAVINGLSQIHGVEIKTTALDPAGQNVTLLYLDALNVSQLSANDFIFSDVTFSSPKSDSEAVATPNLVTNPVPERPAQTTSIPPTTVLEREMTRRPFPQFNIRPMPPLPQVELPSLSDILQQLRETEIPPIREIPAITLQPLPQVELPSLSDILQQLRETELLPIQEIPAITPQTFLQVELPPLSNTLQQLRETEIPPIREIPAITLQPLPQVELPSLSDILQQLRETELLPIQEIPAITPQTFLQVELPPLSNTLQQLRETELLPIQEIPAITPQPFPQFALSPITMPSIPSVRAEKTAYRMVSKNQPWNSGALSSLFTLRKRQQPMTYTVVLADGSPLPTWLALDTEKNVLTGILGTGTADKASLKVTATDEKGFSVSTILELQAYANVLDVDAFQTVAVSDNQAAINASNDFSKVTATGGNHVLFMNGSMSSANLLGNGKNKVIVAGSSNKITLGEGNNDIRLTGSSAVLVAGNGNNAVNATGSFIDITLGNGNNTIHGEVEKLIVGNGDNTITNSATLAKLKLGEGKNTVVLSGDMATINVGRGHYNLRYSGDMGKLVFNKSIPFDRLWFKHHQQDLHVSVGGSKGKVTLKNWYASTPERPSAIIAGDGKRLSKNDVEPLVQAMSTFTSSDTVTRNFTPAEKQLLQPILAANWR